MFLPLCSRKLFNEYPWDDPAYSALPEDQPGGFNWAGDAPAPAPAAQAAAAGDAAGAGGDAAPAVDGRPQ